MIMEKQNVAFTLVDSVILDSYKGALAGLSAYLGDGYEIVLHSLEDLDHSVVAIFNGERSGRQVGAPITNLALQMLTRIEDENMQDSIIYFNRNDGGKSFKSATIVIRGERQRVIGLLCINYDLDQPLSKVMRNLSPSNENHAIQSVEVLADHSDQLIVSMLEEIRSSVYADASVTPVNRNKEIVRQLDDKGVFKLKNAVVKVAEQLDLSRNTVYMHLRNLDKKEP